MNWMKLLLKIVVEVLPIVVGQVSREQQHGFVAVDDTEARNKVKSLLNDAVAVLDRE